MSEWQVSLGSLIDSDDRDEHQRGTFAGMAGERFTRVLRAQPFGFTSNPPAGSRGLLLFGGANREAAVAIGMEAAAHRPRNLPTGATAIYGANGEVLSMVGKVVRIKADLIILDGVVRLGGVEASRPVSMRDSTDSAGHRQTGALASKVFAL